MQKLMPVVLLFLFSLPTFGQKAEVFGGYQLTHFDGGPNSNGWNAALTGNFLPFLGVTADFSGVYNSGTHFYTYTFGPEVHARALGVKPFAHALFGGGTFSRGGVGLHHIHRWRHRCQSLAICLRKVGASGLDDDPVFRCYQQK
jgi:hypothetical protein